MISFTGFQVLNLKVVCLSFIICIHWTGSSEFPLGLLLLLEVLASCWGVELGRGHGKVTFITCLIINLDVLHVDFEKVYVLNHDLTFSLAYGV